MSYILYTQCYNINIPVTSHWGVSLQSKIWDGLLLSVLLFGSNVSKIGHFQGLFQKCSRRRSLDDVINKSGISRTRDSRIGWAKRVLVKKPVGGFARLVEQASRKTFIHT